MASKEVLRRRQYCMALLSTAMVTLEIQTSLPSSFLIFTSHHMRTSANVVRTRFAVHPSRVNCANVVCVDFLPDTMKDTRVNDICGRP